VVDQDKNENQAASREISPRQTARLLGVRLEEVYNLLWAGKLKGRKADGRWLICETEVRQRAQRRLRGK